jgi:hypothetical protein
MMFRGGSAHTRGQESQMMQADKVAFADRSQRFWVFIVLLVSDTL